MSGILSIAIEKHFETLFPTLLGLEIITCLFIPINTEGEPLRHGAGGTVILGRGAVISVFPSGVMGELLQIGAKCGYPLH